MKSVEEIAKQIAKEMMKELEENAIKTGSKIDFDTLEKATLIARQQFGECLMQEMIEMKGAGKLPEKKTATDVTKY